MVLVGFQPLCSVFLPLPLRKMSTSTSTSTQPTKEIDLQESQRVINEARQLPLHGLAFKTAFTEATQDIARIAENANPEDPNLLNVEVAAIKVRPSRFCSRCWLRWSCRGARCACPDAYNVRWESIGAFHGHPIRDDEVSTSE